MNTGSKNILGRTILQDNKGKRYVLGPRGGKHYKFTVAAAKTPSPKGPRPEGPKNSLGREILVNNKGKRYVLGPRGGKHYKFTVAAAKTPSPKGPRPEGPKNSLGREILVNNKGKRYVLGPRGGKHYKFTMAKTPSPKGPTVAAVIKTPLKQKLKARTRLEEDSDDEPTEWEAPYKKRIPTVAAVIKTPLKQKLKALLARTRRRLVYLKNSKKTFSPKTIDYTLPRFNSKRNATLGMLAYEYYNSKNANAVIAQMKDTGPQQEWLDEQAEFISSLNKYEFDTLSAYTVRSHEWIGPFLRNGTLPKPSDYTQLIVKDHAIPLLPQLKLIYDLNDVNTKRTIYKTTIKRKKINSTVFLKPIPDTILRGALELYARNLEDIISRAPPLPADMYVYRGTKDDVFRGKLGTVHSLKGFASTSYLLNKAVAYAGTDNTIQRIKLLKGTRVIAASLVNQWNSQGENEVIINQDAKYIIRSRNVKRRIIDDAKQRIATVTDVTLIK